MAEPPAPRGELLFFAADMLALRGLVDDEHLIPEAWD